MNIRRLNKSMDKFLNEGVLDDLKDDIVNSKTVKNIKQGINKVGQNIKNVKMPKVPSMKQLRADVHHALNKNDISTEEGVDKELQYLFNKYVPRSGSADTVGGEIVRALNKLIYRLYNDGDMFCCNYGIETCAPCAIYLEKTIKNGAIDDLLHAMSDNDTRTEDRYQDQLKQLTKLIVQYLTENKQLFKTKNTDDMYNYGPDENDMEYYYDIEDWSSGHRSREYYDEYESIEYAESAIKEMFDEDDVVDYYLEDYVIRNMSRGDEVALVTVELKDDEEIQDEYAGVGSVDDDDPNIHYFSIMCSNVYFRL